MPKRGGAYVNVLYNVLASDERGDNNEVCAFQWWTPGTVIQNYIQSKIGAAPPQLFEVSRLMNFHDIEKLEAYMWRRSGGVITRILPVSIHCDDGIVVTYPGELYICDMVGIGISNHLYTCCL